MEKLPSLESRAAGRKRSEPTVLPASITAAKRPHKSTKQPRSRELVVLPTPAAAPLVDNHNYDNEEDEFDMNDEMSEERLPPHVMTDSENEGQQGNESVDGVSSKLKSSRKRKNGIPVSPKVKEKRARGKRSKCWQHFTMVKVEGEDKEKAKCNYCGDLFLYKQGGQTSSLNRHVKTCPSYRALMRGKSQGQGTLNFEPGSSLTSVCTEYNPEETRKIIAKMIIVHDYPFRMVEHKWFNILMRHMNPAYKFIGRKTIRKECIKVYESEKELLKKSFRDVEHICLTSDLWTSNQNLSYMTLVAHYIDAEWVMQCRVLNFIELDPPHSGSIIAQAIFECLCEWKIEDKVISITVDNARNNDGAVKNLINKFVARKVAGFISSHFHVRCCAHIVNLVVNDGLAPLQDFISSLRETVKYLKKSPSRMYKFLEVCKTLNIERGAGLCLDVSTRWNSTYKMFDSCTPYRHVFHEYADSDMNCTWEPSNADWNIYSMVQPILTQFAEITKVLSGSVYPTANPRWNMRFVGYCFRKIYGEVKGCEEEAEVRKELYDLYDTYEAEYRQKNSTKSSCTSSSMQSRASTTTVRPSGFRNYLQATATEASKSELLLYLDEANVDPEDQTFVLLDWWKVNAHRFPVISKMARRFLTILATSVSSESTVSTGGRILDDYRSSLRPAMVEALVCASSFIRGSHKDNQPPIIVRTMKKMLN